MRCVVSCIKEDLLPERKCSFRNTSDGPHEGPLPILALSLATDPAVICDLAGNKKSAVLLASLGTSELNTVCIIYYAG